MKEVVKEIEAYNQKCYDYAMELEAWAEELGPILREGRQKKGFTLRAMAKKLDISAPFLSDMELGKRGISENILERLKKLI